MSFFKRSEGPIGESGESLAAKFLREQGLEILAVNYWTKVGEIDIIAREGETLVFAEVKTRASTTVALPERAVTAKKQRTINRVAEAYMRRNSLLHKVNARFDIVSIVKDEAGNLTVEKHIRRAFDAPKRSY
ncbi:MAG: YraN family protein [Candidatus Coatesbacteria bacterium]|nr:YraN family protein [Candidatus Coatesbacteria bacterium]